MVFFVVWLNLLPFLSLPPPTLLPLLSLSCISQMKMVIEKELKLANLQVIDITVTKIIQLFETKNSRSASHTSIVLIACCINFTLSLLFPAAGMQ